MFIDKNFKITHANSEFCKYYNLSKEEVIGSYCYNVIHKLDEPCSFQDNVCPLEHVIKTKKSYRSLHKHSIKGKKILIEQFTTPFIIKNGEIQSICKIGKKFREYATGGLNNIDSNINLKQKMSELCHDLQNYVELSIFFLKQHRNEEEFEILLKEMLQITKYGNELLSLQN